MNKKMAVILLAVIAIAVAVGGLSTVAVNAALPGEASGSSPSAQKGVKTLTTTETHQAIKADVSPPLYSLPMAQAQSGGETPNIFTMHAMPGSDAPSNVVDSVVQRIKGAAAIPTPMANFEGMYNYWGGIPPDTIGDVGPNHYVQQVNVGVQVFSKTGASLAGPISFNRLFTGFGGDCENRNNGDPVVLYDQLADRWFLSQFAFPSTSGPTYQCIAISTSPDPTGTYYRYAFLSASVGFDDYPHYGVWPDAYYMTANRFNAPGFAGSNIAYERPRMLVGDPTARMVVFLLPNQGGALPTDLEGFTLPPAGTPNFIFYPTNSGAGTINMYKFDADFDGTSSFTGPFPVTGVAPWDPDLCAASREQCIDQPNTTARLEAIADRFMHRITYRNMGTHEAVMISHTVDGSGTGIAGLRWYEVRTPNTVPTVFQQGTFAPADGLHRWMGSIAMDRLGNIAAGYSISSSTVFPSIRYAGRLASDPPGTFGQGEETLFNGTGSEDFPAAPRWGDYSSLNVDPNDDCTFWYTTEYFARTGDRNWRTRIGSFKMPNCVGGTATPRPTSTGPVPTSTPTPQATATVCPGGIQVTGVITNSDPTQAGRLNRDGNPSVCGVQKAFPGTADANTRHYDSYTLTNTSGSTQCVTVQIGNQCGDNHLLSMAYLGSFDPNNLSANYLADMGAAGPTFSYSFSVPAGATYVVVVNEGVANLGCDSYSIRISPCVQGALTPTATSTPPLVTSTPTATPAGCIPTYTTAVSTATIIPATNDVGNSCDDCTTQINLPFPVQIYGSTFTTARVGSNGNMQFASDNPNIYDPNCIPVAGSGVNPPFQNVIFAFYDDLRTDTDANDGIYTATIGTAPNRQFVVRWLTTFFSGAGTAEFEIVLNENSSVITTIYGPSRDSGANASAGMQYNATVATQYTCDMANLVNGRRVDYIPTGCTTPTVVPPTATATRTVAPTNTPVTCSIQFTDVPPGATFYDEIRCLACRNIIDGYACGGTNPETGQAEPCNAQNWAYFRPNNRVIRGQVAKIVSNSSNDFSAPGPQIYADVPTTHTFFAFINRLTNRGVMGGYPCGGINPQGGTPEPCNAQNQPYFRPFNYATRGQIAQIVARGANITDPVPAGTHSFTDVPPASTFYLPVERLRARGVMSGYPCGGVNPQTGAPEPCDAQNRPYFRVNNNATRGQTSQIVSRTFFPGCIGQGR